MQPPNHTTLFGNVELIVITPRYKFSDQRSKHLQCCESLNTDLQWMSRRNSRFYRPIYSPHLSLPNPSAMFRIFSFFKQLPNCRRHITAIDECKKTRKRSIVVNNCETDCERVAYVACKCIGLLYSVRTPEPIRLEIAHVHLYLMVTLCSHTCINKH